MNNLVYLFELDSVKKQETLVHNGVIETDGVCALFHEIINNGNCVAISMNQLTDSPFFAQAVRNEFAYPLLLRMFESGALRVSLYGEIRTASQYVQRAIEKCLSRNKDSFIFSNLPVNNDETELLCVIHDALRFSDLSQIQARISCSQVSEQERLEYISRFVNMILKLSTAEIGSIPSKIPAGRNFEFFLYTTIRLLKMHSFFDSKLDSEIQIALDLLEKKGAAITEGRNNRSNWLKVHEGEVPLTPIAVMIINLCYNYTVEDSINGVCKHYDDANFEESFLRDLKKRIQNEYAKPQRKDNITIKKQKWKRAVRFAEYRKKRTLVFGGVYEDIVPKAKTAWKTLAIARAIGSLGWASFYAALFFFTEWSMGWIEDTYSISLQNTFISTILNILIFSLMGSIMGTILKKINRGQDVPDLFECITDIFERISDSICILCGGKHDI